MSKLSRSVDPMADAPSVHRVNVRLRPQELSTLALIAEHQSMQSLRSVSLAQVVRTAVEARLGSAADERPS